MLKIRGYNIELTRGDSAYITVQILDNDGNKFLIQGNDKVRIQVRSRPNTGKLLFEAKMFFNQDKDLVWYIRPEDTKNTKAGKYVYDAQVELANGDIFTFIPMSTFEIADEVTMD